jgi:hypothetical protein
VRSASPKPKNVSGVSNYRDRLPFFVRRSIINNTVSRRLCHRESLKAITDRFHAITTILVTGVTIYYRINATVTSGHDQSGKLVSLIDEREFDMDDIFGQAWSAAQKTIGPDLWERLPDAIRVHAAYEQICRMDAGEMQGRPLFGDMTAQPS